MFASLVGAPLQTLQGTNSLARVDPPAAQARSEDEQDLLSIRASEEEWDEPPILFPAASSREEVSLTQPPRALIATPLTGEPSVDRDPKPPTTEEMFPPQLPFKTLPSEANVREYLDTIRRWLPEIEFESGAREEPASHSWRRLSVEQPEPTAPVPRFPLDSALVAEIQAWGRVPAGGWTSFPKELDRAVRVTDANFNQFIRSPPIPDQVYNLLGQQAVSGSARVVSGSGIQGPRFKDPAGRAREESLRALDRAARSAVKFQGLAIWLTESVGAMVEQGSVSATLLRSTLSGLTGMIDATVGQLGRIMSRIGTERRDNVIPLLNLGEATAADLRRLPQEGPDLFAGRFGDVVARQANHQDALRKTQKLLDRSRPAATSKRAPRGRSSRGVRGSRRPYTSGAGQQSTQQSPGQVSVRGGKRTFTPRGTSAPKHPQRRF